MSKSHGRKGAARARPRRASIPDGAVYIGILMIGIFGVLLWWIVSGEEDEDSWKHGLLGYVIAVAVLVNLHTWRAYFGRHLSGWQQSLARLVLRWAGFGTKGGRPLEAAHGSDRAKIMLFLSLATSALLIAAVTWLLYEVL